MNDRRRSLLNLYTKEDIPSNAIELNYDNQNTTFGNVIYIPLNGQKRTASLGGQERATVYSYNNSTNVGVDSILGLNLTATSGDNKYFSLYLPEYYGNSYGYLPFTIVFNGGNDITGNFVFPYGNQGSNPYLRINYPEDTIYYIKVKFKINVRFSFNYSYQYNWFESIYIDTE